MARKPRLHYQGAFYHVMLRGNDGQQIFFMKEDREYFYSLLQDGVNRYDYRVHGFCLMSNHVHLVIQVGSVALSKIIQNISFRFTRRINKLQNKIGHLFQGRFKAILVDADSYLLELIRYIHLNPVRAKMVDNLEDYNWSSHRAYLGIDLIPWLTRDFVLSYFSRDNFALKLYMQYMQKENVGNSLQKEFHIGNQKKFSVLANDDFLLKLQKNSISLDKPKINLEKLIEVVCSYYQIEKPKLMEKSRSRNLTEIRAIVGWLAKDFQICSLARVAACFNRDPTGLIRSIRHFDENPEAKAKLNEMRDWVLKSIFQV